MVNLYVNTEQLSQGLGDGDGDRGGGCKIFTTEIESFEWNLNFSKKNIGVQCILIYLKKKNPLYATICYVNVAVYRLPS